MNQTELTNAQKVLLTKVGLLHTDWDCFHEDKEYLHIIRKASKPAEIRIIDRVNKKVLEPTKANQDNQITT